MPATNPLQATVETVRLTDREIRQVMRNASAEADRMIRSMGEDLTSSQRMRKLQLELAKVNADAWKNVKDATTVGIGDAFDASAEFQARFDEAMMHGIGQRNTYWRNSMLAASRQGLPNYLARRENGFTLSERVYRNQALSKGYIDRAINNGLILGKSQREIAADVKQYINPDVAGGASYAAMRLARTEVVNAYHRNSINRYKETPWVEKVLWNLSGSHGKPDACNDYADSSHYSGRGWQAGEWLPGDVPDKPHPNCLCYVSPVVMDLDAYAKAFKAGKYDEYIDKQMGCSRVA